MQASIRPDGAPNTTVRDYSGNTYDKFDPSGHWDFWKDYAYGFEYPFATLMTYAVAAQWLDDPQLESHAVRLAECYRKRLPANGGREHLSSRHSRRAIALSRNEALTRLESRIIPVCRGGFMVCCAYPCRAEILRLEKELWKTYRANGLALLVIGKSVEELELRQSKEKHELTLPMAAHPDAIVFHAFAKERIPRHYVISRKGRIVYQSLGYTAPKFRQLVKAVEKELAK